MLQGSWQFNCQHAVHLVPTSSDTVACRAITSSAWRKLLEQRESWHSHVVAQPLLPAYKRYLLDQPDLHSALLTTQRSTACIQRGRAEATEFRYPAMRVQFMAASPAADALALYIGGQVTIIDLPDHAVRWHTTCDLNSTESAAHWSPDSTMFYSSCARSYKMLSSHDGTVLGTCRSTSRTVLHSAWHPQSTSLALVFDLGDVIVLRPGDDLVTDTSMGSKAAEVQWGRQVLKWAPNGQVLIHCTLKAVNFCSSTGSHLDQVKFDMHAAIGSCAWSSSSDLLAVSFLQDSAGILFYNPEAVLMTRMVMARPCAQLAWAGSCLAAQCNGFVRVLSTAEPTFGAEICSVPAQVDYFTTPAWHISGKYLALSCADATIKVVHGRSGSTVWTWPDQGGAALQHRFPRHSPTWSASGQELFFYLEHDAFGMMVAFQ